MYTTRDRANTMASELDGDPGRIRERNAVVSSAAPKIGFRLTCAVELTKLAAAAFLAGGLGAAVIGLGAGIANADPTCPPGAGTRQQCPPADPTCPPGAGTRQQCPPGDQADPGGSGGSKSGVPGSSGDQADTGGSGAIKSGGGPAPSADNSPPRMVLVPGEPAGPPIGAPPPSGTPSPQTVPTPCPNGWVESPMGCKPANAP
ncbi:hypothetical protein C8E89_14531 [Mycolicibacterium moriokaense]|uniref:Uncharacterized protein n=1 Tax=Mycolicibacterium moriokaense TaxID=39691 RepID=A0A318H736_9MYCO|nr:hypothetical protein C8E89_14531 [Mycolicibacterium moriokaense]